MINYRELFQAAFERRSQIQESTLRLFDGRSDGVDRLVIERFGTAYRVRGGDELANEYSQIESALRDIVGEKADIFYRFTHACEGGPEGDDGVRIVDEGNLRFEVKLLHNRNTGLFLDARPARAFIRSEAGGRRVLNLFAYTCGFGVAAASGGAKSTVNVDAVPAVLKTGQRNYELNSLAYDGRTFWKNDVKAAIKKARSQGAQYDAIILDPPPVLQGATRSSKVHATDGSTDLNTLIRSALTVAAPRALVVVCCASLKLSDAALMEMLTHETGLSSPVTTFTSGDDFRPGPNGERLRVWVFEAPSHTSFDRSDHK